MICEYLSEAMLRYEGDARPEDLRILRVQGDSMESLLREGGQLMGGISRGTPATEEVMVLWDGTGLGSNAPRSRPTETRPRLPDYPGTLALTRKRTSSARCCGRSGRFERRQPSGRRCTLGVREGAGSRLGAEPTALRSGSTRRRTKRKP